MVTNNSGEIIKTEFLVEGRKQPLIEIRKNGDMWHDLSTVANHSHLVFMVSCLYDPAIHYTNEEYLKMTNIKEDVQTRVE
jgi:hypothetical protein